VSIVGGGRAMAEMVPAGRSARGGSTLEERASKGSGRSPSRLFLTEGPYDVRPPDSRHPSLPPALGARSVRRRGGGTTLVGAPGGVVLTGTHRPCMPELGVRFPSPPSPLRRAVNPVPDRAAARVPGRRGSYRGRSGPRRRGPARPRRESEASRCAFPRSWEASGSAIGHRPVGRHGVAPAGAVRSGVQDAERSRDGRTLRCSTSG
jgi:hypothetical protein